MFGIGTPELIIIAIVALLIFGPSKLPELGKTLGKGLREFKKASSNLKDQMNPINEEDGSARETPTLTAESVKTPAQGPRKRTGAVKSKKLGSKIKIKNSKSGTIKTPKNAGSPSSASKAKNSSKGGRGDKKTGLKQIKDAKIKTLTGQEGVENS